MDSRPLADRLRPQSVGEVVGQKKLLGGALATAFASGRLHSMILWGPPGSGKTTLARLLVRAAQAEWFALSAVTAGLKDLREIIAQARDIAARPNPPPRALFVDEVHRFNKAQQDAFLPHVEEGLFVFIGATTENPAFEVNSALLSRATVHVLEPLGDGELREVLARAAKSESLQIAADAADALIDFADGDARRLLNAVELLIPPRQQQAGAGQTVVTVAQVKAATAMKMRRFDKGGDNFYDQISALHKSVRGSDPDAALYWLCRMLDGGADPSYVSRRVLRMAAEDIGLADPRGLQIALAADETYRRLGSPEGELAIAEAVVYLACCSKSDAVYRAFGAAQKMVKDDSSRPVPPHLRNAPTRLAKQLGHGRDYRHAHNEEHAYAAGERYFPAEIKNPPRFYRPTARGLEAKIRERLEHLRKLDAAAKKQSL